MTDLTIFLYKTTKVQFCEWLINYSKKLNLANAEYPYHGNGVYRVDYPRNIFQVNTISFSARIKQHPLSDGEPPTGVDQREIVDNEAGVKCTYWEWVIENIIKMEWVEVEERLRVTITYDDSLWILPPMFQLLWAIKVDFPSTTNVILNHIREKADWWNLQLPLPINDAAIATIIAMQAKEEIRKKEADTQTIKIVETKSRETKQKRGAQLKTENSLKRLREIRSDAIKNHRPIPTKAAAMNDAGITDKTWKNYDQELWARWDDKSYIPEKQE